MGQKLLTDALISINQDVKEFVIDTEVCRD
jgi:hypothetical protein